MNRDKEGPRSMEARYFDIGVVGRRTGITMKENVKKDADGLDNFDDFWDEGAEERRRTMVFGDTASEDDLGGDDYYVGTPSSRQRKSLAHGSASTPARAFLQQELPSELLSTPTSRRGKNASLYRASDPSDRAMEDYPSPSFQAVKKRLVFTKDGSDNDEDEYSGVTSSFTSRTEPNRGLTRSPALDKLLTASKEKKAQIQHNTSLSMSPMSPFKDTRKLPSASTAVSRSKLTAKTAAAATKAIVSAAATTTSRTNGGQRKAFDFGVEYSPVAQQENRSEDVEESRYAFSDDEDEQDTFRSTTPPPRSKTAQTAKAADASKTPAEFKRKQPAQGAKMISATLHQRSAPAPKSRPQTQHHIEDDYDQFDNDYEEHDEGEANEDRFQFSDEEDIRRLSHRYAQEEPEEEEEEEEEPLVRRSKATRNAAPTQQKRTVGAEDSDTQPRSKLTATGSGRAKKDIPKNTKKQQQQRPPSKAKTVAATSKAKSTKNPDILSEEEEAASEDEDEEGGDGQVPNRSGRSKPAKKANRSRTTTTSSGAAARKRDAGDRLQLTEVPVVPDSAADQPGVRRSHRTRLQPLEFWRNEKVVLGPSDDLHVPVPSIKAVIRAAPEEPIRLGAKRRRGGKSSRASKVKEAADEENSEEEDEEKVERELEKERRDLARRGFVEDKTPKLMEIIDYKTNGISKRVLAAPRSQMDFREVEGGEYQFHRGLEDIDSSMVSGVMKIRGGGEKPMTSTGTACTMLFYVLKGIVQVTVNERKFVVSTGAQFVVPRGNQYNIANLSRMESHLYFVQAKTSSTEGSASTAGSNAGGVDVDSSSSATIRPASQGRPQSQISSFFH